MLVDGNDERGIDVGIMTSAGYSVWRMTSHVDGRDANANTIFSGG